MKIKGLAILLCCAGILFTCYVASFYIPLMTARGRFCELSELPWPEEGRLVKAEHQTVGRAFSRLFIVEVPVHRIKDWVKTVQASNGIRWNRSQLSLYPPLMPYSLWEDEYLWCTFNLEYRNHVMVVVDEQAERLYVERWGN